MASTPEPTTKQCVLNALMEASALSVAGLTQRTGRPVSNVHQAVLSLRLEGYVRGTSKAVYLTRRGEKYVSILAETISLGQRRYKR